jgi:DNA polymerase-4
VQVAGEVTDRPVARVVVKVRYAPFITITHGTTVPPGERWPPGAVRPDPGALPLDDAAPTPDSWAAVIGQAAQAALTQFTPGRAVRLLGVRAEFDDKPG